MKTNYPKIEIVISYDENVQLYVDKLLGTHNVAVYHYEDETDDGTLIAWNNENLTLVSLDNNCTILKTDDYYLVPKQEGSTTLSAYFLHEGVTLLAKKETVVYGNFFRENYLSLFSNYDRDNILSNTYVRIMFDTCMEFFDILWAYQKDLLFVRDPINIKFKFLNVLGNSLGLGSLQQWGNITKDEVINIRLYRELLNNLLDLLKIRGTKLAYELFFGALGYDIKLLEYWFDENGDLIEINPVDDSLSTFYAINTDGMPLEEAPIPHNDPRKNLSPNNFYNFCNKSPYVKPIFSFKSNFEGLISYSNDQRVILKEYLEWLRPNHIIFLDEVIGVLLPQTGSDILPYLMETENAVTLAKLTRPYTYIDVLDQLKSFSAASGTDWIDLNEILEDDIEYGYYDLAEEETSKELVLSNSYAYDPNSKIKSVLINLTAQIDGENELNEIQVGVKIPGYIIRTGSNLTIQQNYPILIGAQIPYEAKKEVNIYAKISFQQNSTLVEVAPIQVGTEISNVGYILGVNGYFKVEEIQIGSKINEVNVILPNLIVPVYYISVGAKIESPNFPYWRLVATSDNWIESGWKNIIFDITPELSSWGWEDIGRIILTLQAENLDLYEHQFQLAAAQINFLAPNNLPTEDFRPYYLKKNGLTERLDYNYTDEYLDVLGNKLFPDPGRFEFAGAVEYGPWNNSGGGMVVEDLKDLTESFIISYPFNIYDIIRTLPKYDNHLYYDGYVYENQTLIPPQPTPSEEDSIPPEHWSDENWMGVGHTYGLGPSPGNLFYDIGLMLDETVPNVISINEFNELYEKYKLQGLSEATIKTNLMTFYSISSTQYDYLISL